MFISCTTCNIQFSRKPSQAKRSKRHFCSNSCAATFNNKLYPKKKMQVRICSTCKERPIKESGLKNCFICKAPKRNNPSLDEILILNSDFSSSVVRRKILKYNLRDYICSLCSLNPTWNGKLLTLHLDHINGINNDNRLENLRFLCPNCHTQTPTYCSKNWIYQRTHQS